MKRIVLIAAGVLLLLVVAAQLVPVARTNPPVEADLAAPSEVAAVLRAACYDCHSHETRWPWYSHVAPVSWLIANDVKHARKKMDFSRWGTYESKKQARLQEEIWQEVASGEMPPAVYRMAHPEARLTESAKETLHAWSAPADDRAQK